MLDRRFTILCLFLFLVVFVNACSTQSPSNPEGPIVQVNDKAQVMTTTIDSSLQLKFTSGIRSILEDQHGNIWFGSHQEGVCLFDGTSMRYFTTKDGLSDNQVRSIFEDANGVVWFEGGRGLSSYDGEKIHLRIERNYDSKNEWQLGEHDLWFKGDESMGYNAIEREAGVYRYDGKELHYHLLPIPANQANGSSYSISTPFCRGKNGRLWLGTYEAVFGYDGTAFTIIGNEDLGVSKEMGMLHVRSIFEDSKEALWIGNNGLGVLRYVGDTLVNFSAMQGLRSIGGLYKGGAKSSQGTLEHVFSIGEDREGNMWFGDRDTGAWRYDGQSMKNFTKADGVSTPHIWQIYNSKKGQLWFAMGDGTVLEFNGDSFDRVF